MPSTFRGSDNFDTAIDRGTGTGGATVTVAGLVAGSLVDDITAWNNSGLINQAIQLTVAAKETNGGVTVEIPAGVYTLYSPIILPSDVTLKGQGVRGSRATVLKPWDALPIGYGLIESEGFYDYQFWMVSYQRANNGVPYSPGAPAIGSLDPATRPVPTRIQFSAVEGIHIDGSKVLGIGIGIIGLECVIQNCTVRYCTSSAIWLGGWVPLLPTESTIPYLTLNNVISNNLLIKDLSGVRMAGPCILESSYTADTRIQNNYIEGSDQAGIFSSGSNCRIQGNHIYDCNNGVESRDSHEKFITDNYIENMNTHGVLVYNGAAWEDGASMVITNNILRNINVGQLTPGVDQAAINAADSLVAAGFAPAPNVCIARAAIMVYEAPNNNSLNNIIVTNNILRRDANDPNTGGTAWLDNPPAPFWNSTVSRGKVPYMVAVVAAATDAAGAPVQLVVANNLAQSGIATLGLQNLALARIEADISVW